MADEQEIADPRSAEPPAAELAGLAAAVQALPEEIIRNLSRGSVEREGSQDEWRRRLALAGTIAAAASGTYAIVSNLTQPTIAQQVAPISHTAARLDHGLSGMDAFIARVRGGYAQLKADVTGRPVPGAQAPAPRRVIQFGKSFRITLDRHTSPAQETRRILGAWARQSSSP
jgi:hypothetical protein